MALIVAAWVGPLAWLAFWTSLAIDYWMELALGARRKGRGLRYPVNEVALRHGAGVTKETSDPADAYAGFPDLRPASAPDALSG